MNGTKRVFRLVAVLVAAFALIGFSSLSTSAQTADTATIRIHKATCPEGTGADIFEQCHDDALAGITFEIVDESLPDGLVTVTTGANGRASREVVAGEVTITEDADDFADYVGARVYCSVLGTNEVLIDETSTTGEVTFDAAADEEIICDWYNLTGVDDGTATPTATSEPEPTAPTDLATVRIHKATCPEATEGDIFEACHENALEGITFDINGELVTTGENGRASRSVDPGSITVTEDEFDAADFAGSRVVCTEQASQDVLVDESTDTGSVSFDAAAGDEVICDWYNIEGATDETPTSGPSATAAATSDDATSTSEAGSATTLPDTGAGASGGSSNSMLLIVAVLLSVIGGAFILRKQQLA